jgi:hypothetical protein
MVAYGNAHLVCYVWSCLANITAHLPHYTNVIIAVEEIVLVFSTTRTSSRSMALLVRLEGGIAEDDNESLCVLVVACDGHMLLCNESW